MQSRPQYDVAVLVDGQPVEHRVEITAGDQLRAEFEAKKAGLGPMGDAPLNHTAVWIWCALTREELYGEPFQQFRSTDLYAFENVPDDEEAAADPSMPESASG
jgi:hypothetical protein